jgi:photosystem I P700 chlorophyll a apoprotein A2
VNSLAVWAWMFLFGHLVWASGFMFLISWWELIETLACAHERTPRKSYDKGTKLIGLEQMI